MTAVLSDYHGHTYDISDSQEATKRFDWQAGLIMPSGSPGQVIWVGAEDGRKVLRVDIDTDEGRAALRWLPDGSHAVELDSADPIEVYGSHAGGVEHIPAELARVSVDTARRAVVEYVTTGRKPTGVTWEK